MLKNHLTIGVLALQGAFVEHIKMLEKLSIKPIEVRLPEHLANINGLIIPGGESTTISKLSHHFDLINSIKDLAKKGLAIWGTCAGAILLANQVVNSKVPTLQLMDMTIERNAFGRQINSFVTDLNFPAIGTKPFKGIFIRAPKILTIGEKVTPLITLDDGTIVATRQDNLLATVFHPELTNDPRIHEYFLTLASHP